MFFPRQPRPIFSLRGCAGSFWCYRAALSPMAVDLGTCAGGAGGEHATQVSQHVGSARTVAVGNDERGFVDELDERSSRRRL